MSFYKYVFLKKNFQQEDNLDKFRQSKEQVLKQKQLYEEDHLNHGDNLHEPLNQDDNSMPDLEQ